MDLKCGNGAFMASRDEARSLAETMVSVAVGAGISARALLTNMDQVLGDCVGNALEVGEAIAYLKGERRNPRLNELVMTLCSEALMLKNLAADEQEARTKLQQALDCGKAAECFAKMTAALGGPSDLLEDPWKYLPKAAVIRPVYTDKTGYVSAMDTYKIGTTMIILGGQRKTLTSGWIIPSVLPTLSRSATGWKRENRLPLFTQQTKTLLPRRKNSCGHLFKPVRKNRLKHRLCTKL